MRAREGRGVSIGRQGTSIDSGRFGRVVVVVVVVVLDAKVVLLGGGDDDEAVVVTVIEGVDQWIEAVCRSRV